MHRALPRIKFVDTHVYTWVERGAVRVKSEVSMHKMQRPQPSFTPGARFSKDPISFRAQKAIGLLVNCWRAVARQLSILYNSEIWPKSVRCKIVDLRSRIPSLYPGACGFGDMCSRFLKVWDMLVNAHGNIDRNLSNSRNQGHVKRSEFLHRCLLLVEEFIKVMNSLEMTLKEEKGQIFKCLVAHSQLYSSKSDR